MRTINETETRKQFIDPALESAGWHLHDKSRVRVEVALDGWDGFMDYCLYRANGEIIAVVEAKHLV